MNYSPMYMYESSGPMHIHKIILLTPRDRRQIVGANAESAPRAARRGGGSDEAVRYKSRCSVALKDARFLRHGGRARDSERCILCECVCGGRQVGINEKRFPIRGT